MINLKVGILSAQTGNGHISVANAIQREFANRNIHAESFNSFYEDLMISNKIISDYYNFLMITSTELCCKFSELSCLTRPDISETFYQGVQDNLKKFVLEHEFDIIISTSHTINHSVIRALRELGLESRIKYYIIITDPFHPISVGFDAEEASRYYCSSTSVMSVLKKRKIDGSKIVLTAYPVHERFLRQYSDEVIDNFYKKLKLSKKSKTILINSGSQGAYHYIKFLKAVLDNFKDLQVIFISGKNESLYGMACLAAEGFQKRARILKYIDNIEAAVKISDFVLTKPGANAFFECVYMQKPMLIDGVNGFLYQEKGVLEFLKSFKVGLVIDNYDKLVNAIDELLIEENYIGYKNRLSAIHAENGAKSIVDDILKTYR